MRFLFTVMLILFVLGSLNCYETDFSLNPFDGSINDSRGYAMGKTSLLSSSGANYLFNNPANLIKVESNSFRLSGRGIMGNNEYENSSTDYDFPLHYRVSSIAFVMNPDFMFEDDIDVSFGLGWGSFFDFSRKFEVDSSSKANLEIEYKGGFNTLVLGAGVSYLEKYNIGISLSTSMLSSYKIESNSDNVADSEGTKKGTFMTIGSSAILAEYIELGLRLRTGFTMTNEVDDGEDTDVEIPYELALAARITAMENLNFYLEYITRNLGEYRTESSVYEGDLYEGDNGFSFRSGVEFGSQLALRAGFFIESVPMYEFKEVTNYEYIRDEAPVSELGFTGGLGLKFNENMGFDVGVVYSSVKNDYTYASDFGDDIKVDESYNRFKMTATIGYDF